MRTKSSIKSLLAGLLVAASGYSLQASALPLEPFSFHQHSGFKVDGSLTSTDGASSGNDIRWYQFGSSPAPTPGDYNTIAWGVPTINSGGLSGVDPIGPGNNNSQTDFSGLRVIGYEGTIITGVDLGNGTSDWGNWVGISTVYHQNRTIGSQAFTLSTAVIRSTLVFDHDPEGDIHSDINSVGVSFTETLNSGVCPLGDPNNSDCDDIFRFNLGTFAPLTFAFGGHFYQVEFGLSNFVSSVTDFPNCPGFTCTVWTAENVTSSFDVIARIRQVPEPATLLLVSLALIGVGFSVRRSLGVRAA